MLRASVSLLRDETYHVVKAVPCEDDSDYREIEHLAAIQLWRGDTHFFFAGLFIETRRSPACIFMLHFMLHGVAGCNQKHLEMLGSMLQTGATCQVVAVPAKHLISF